MSLSAPSRTATITLITAFGWVDWTAAQTALVGAEAAAVIGLISAVVAHLWPDTPQEHVAIAATFTACISATLALGTGFAWWSFTQEEMSALAAVVTAVFGVGGAILARRNVFAGMRPKKVAPTHVTITWPPAASSGGRSAVMIKSHAPGGFRMRREKARAVRTSSDPLA